MPQILLILSGPCIKLTTLICMLVCNVYVCTMHYFAVCSEDKWINTYLLHGTNSVKVKGLMAREHKHILAKCISVRIG